MRKSNKQTNKYLPEFQTIIDLTNFHRIIVKQQTIFTKEYYSAFEILNLFGSIDGIEWVAMILKHTCKTIFDYRTY